MLRYLFARAMLRFIMPPARFAYATTFAGHSRRAAEMLMTPLMPLIAFRHFAMMPFRCLMPSPAPALIDAF